MKKIITIMSLCIILAMQSCSSDQEPTFPNSTDSEIELSHMVITYNGKTYDTDVITIGDSVEYLNEEYNRLYQSEISKTENLVIAMSNDESGVCHIDYYSSEKQLLEKYKFISIADAKIENLDTHTRGGVINLWPTNPPGGKTLAIAELYDDRNFSDTELIVYAAERWGTTIPKLKDLGFNDKASSIKVFNRMDRNTLYTINSSGLVSWVNPKDTYSGAHLRPILKSYENSNYDQKKGILYCIGTETGSANDHMDYNLRSIGWNDKISSLEWILVVDYQEKDPNYPIHSNC